MSYARLRERFGLIRVNRAVSRAMTKRMDVWTNYTLSDDINITLNVRLSIRYFHAKRLWRRTFRSTTDE